VTDHEQLALARSRLRAVKPPMTPGPAGERPVAHVLVDTPLAHLDHAFDYLVTADQSAACLPGCRVRVRFAGQDVDGFVLSRSDQSSHEGGLTPLRRVVSPEVVLTPAVLELCQEVAQRYVGTTSDVIRLAVPKRHARVEREKALSADGHASVGAPAVEGWSEGREFLGGLAGGASPRAVWTASPDASWAAAFAAAATATVAGGRGVLLCVPDVRDVRRLEHALAGTAVADRAVTLTADLGPAARYRAFLSVVRGESRVVIGTRAATWAPVSRLGLVAIWDDGDDLHAEPRAPYPHAREVLGLRSHLEGAALLVGGYTRTAEGAALVESGWADSLTPPRSVIRADSPRIHVTGESDAEQARDPAARRARLPHRAFEVARSALADGPVLVQVPRGGYLPALACVTCRHSARCAHCHGPLALAAAEGTARCAWCGRPADGWRCERCGGHRFRAPVVGAQRTAEELGRAFPSIPVVSSSAGRVQDGVGPGPALVVATPGAEPVAEGGYAAGLLLDTWLTLGRPGLRTPEESLRRWLNACALVRPAAAGGRVVVMGDPTVPVLQALVRWDPVGFASRELAERVAAHLPPAARLAVLTGPREEVDVVLASLSLPDGAEVLGPLEANEEVQAIVRVPRDRGSALSRTLRQVQTARSAHKLAYVRVQVDPVEIG
jgi:primosomal protein N' (replication factor Y) (superfamily II helicase)